MKDDHNTCENQLQEKKYRATDRSVSESIFFHLCYYQIGIFFSLKEFGPQKYKDLEDLSSIGNRYYFKHCINNLIDNGYIVEVSNG